MTEHPEFWKHEDVVKLIETYLKLPIVQLRWQFARSKNIPRITVDGEEYIKFKDHDKFIEYPTAFVKYDMIIKGDEYAT